ncbi:hypothetical protein [Endozoicomonas arenosclerae]|uniref:hypothetical protein n=1 Tax=Endozoicomonas arenosclerae TaxID=1633495 RepID=UPI0012947165|nr:hypothetical protein [Endozoicomonas arenosclerae]
MKSVFAKLGGVRRKITKSASFQLPSLKTEQVKSNQPPPKPARNLKLRAAMKAEAKLFIQVLPQEGRYTSAPTPKPRTRPSSVSSQQQTKSETDQPKPKPPVAPRTGKAAPRRPQPTLQAKDLVEARQQLKSTQSKASESKVQSEPLYSNSSTSSAYENVSGREQFRYHTQYENVTPQSESDYVSDEDIQKMRQDQLRKKERPTPRPRTRLKDKDDHYSTLNHDTAPKPKPRSYGSEPPPGYARLGQNNTYDVPSNLKKTPEYDVPRKLHTPPGYDVPRSLKDRPSPENINQGNHDVEVWNNPSYGEIPPPLPPRNPVKDRSDSVDPVTGENIYESLDDDELELEMLEKMLEMEGGVDDEVHPNDAFRLVPLLKQLVLLEEEMSDLIRDFKRERPPKTKPLERAVHMKQERLLMKQQLENKGVDKLKSSLHKLIQDELVSPEERAKVRSRVAKINDALAPALKAKYGRLGVEARTLKAPEG